MLLKNYMDATKKRKLDRHRFFHIVMKLKDESINLSPDEEFLIRFLKANQFIDQVQLENALYNLQFEDRGKTVKLTKFNGQLELDTETNFPYWKIALQTNYVTTGRRICLSMSKALFQLSDFIDPQIKIFADNVFVELDRQKLLKLQNTIWYPGYFNQKTVKIADWLRTDKEVQQSIRDTPEKYQELQPAVNEN